MDGTIDVIRSRCGEWSNLYTRAIDLHIVDGRSPWLFRRFRLAVLPGAIGKEKQVPPRESFSVFPLIPPLDV